MRYLNQQNTLQPQENKTQQNRQRIVWGSFYVDQF